MAFTKHTKRLAWERQGWLCADCGVSFIEDLNFYGHHIKRKADGGKNTYENCVILCEDCHYAVHNYGKYRQPIQLDISEYKYYYGNHFENVGEKGTTIALRCLVDKSKKAVIDANPEALRFFYGHSLKLESLIGNQRKVTANALNKVKKELCAICYHDFCPSRAS